MYWHQEKVPVFPEPIWIDPMVITNIMLLNTLKKEHTVVLDEEAKPFTVYARKTGKVIASYQSNNKGLYLSTPMNIPNEIERHCTRIPGVIALVQNHEQKCKKVCTKRCIERA